MEAVVAACLGGLRVEFSDAARFEYLGVLGRGFARVPAESFGYLRIVHEAGVFLHSRPGSTARSQAARELRIPITDRELRDGDEFLGHTKGRMAGRGSREKGKRSRESTCAGGDLLGSPGYGDLNNWP